MKPKNLEKAVQKYGYVFLIGRLQQCLGRLTYNDSILPSWRRHASYVKAMNSIQKTISLLWFYFG